MNGHMKAVRRLYQPTIGAMTANLPALGESLHVAAIELARDPTLEHIDAMVSQLKAAESSLIHLRKALVWEEML